MATSLGSNVHSLPKLAYAAEDVVLLTNIWTDFAHCRYTGDNIEEFCAKYRAALDKCNAADIVIPDKIHVLHFIGILDGHFPQWGANKREAMRRDTNVLPSLDRLMNEIVDESRELDRVKQQRMLQIFHSTQSSLPVHIAVPRFKVNKRGRHEFSFKKVTCNHCGLTHLEEKCWYKNIELRPEGWQPNTLIQQRINEIGRIIKPKDYFGSSPTMRLLHTPSEFTEGQRSDLWIAASGSTHHCCNNEDLFLEYLDDPIIITAANGSITSIISPGRGKVNLTLRQSSGAWLPITLSNVRYTPTVTLNSISEYLLGERGVYWRDEDAKFVHLAAGREIASVIKSNGRKVFIVQ